jgi:hypothetical protein
VHPVIAVIRTALSYRLRRLARYTRRSVAVDWSRLTPHDTHRWREELVRAHRAEAERHRINRNY